MLFCLSFALTTKVTHLYAMRDVDNKNKRFSVAGKAAAS